MGWGMRAGGRGGLVHLSLFTCVVSASGWERSNQDKYWGERMREREGERERERKREREREREIVTLIGAIEIG